MPTEIPGRADRRIYRPGRVLTWPQTVRFFWLFAQASILDARLHRAGRRARLASSDETGDELLRLARRWLAVHAAIGALLEAEEPEAVAQVRIVLSLPLRPSDRQSGQP